MAREFGVYIVESCLQREEDNGTREGQLLREMLHLLDVKSEYLYIRTAKELRYAMKRFQESNYRYLHLSCHTVEGAEELGLTLDNISFKEFSSILPTFSGRDRRRIFVSACSVATKAFAEHVVPKFISIVGPSTDVDWDDAAIYWATFYHQMVKAAESQDPSQPVMKNEDISNALGKLSQTFGLQVRAFFRTADGAYRTQEFSFG